MLLAIVNTQRFTALKRVWWKVGLILDSRTPSVYRVEAIAASSIRVCVFGCCTSSLDVKVMETSPVIYLIRNQRPHRTTRVNE